MKDKGKVIILTGFWLAITLLTILAFAGLINPYKVSSSNNQAELLAPVTVEAGHGTQLSVQFGEPVTSLQASLSLDSGNRNAVVGALDLPGNMENIAIDRDRQLAFLANSYAGVQIADISDPSHIRLLGALATPGNAWDILTKGNLLFVAAAAGGLQVLDVSSPENPKRIGELILPGIAFLKLAVHGDTLYVSCGKHGLQVIDIADPGAPRLIESFKMPAGAWGILTVGDYLYLSSDRYHLDVFALADPKKPKRIRRIDLPDLAWELADRNHYLFLATRGAGLLVFDIADPHNPARIPPIMAQEEIDSIFIDDTRVLLTNRKKEMFLVDITDPTEPRIILDHDLFITPRSSILIDNLAYIAGGLSGLRVIDIDKVALSGRHISLPVPGGLQQVLFDDDYFYLATNVMGLHVARRTGKDQRPAIVASLPLPGQVQKMTRSGNYLYLACSNSGLQIVDISNPLDPRLVGSLNQPGSFSDLAMSGNNLFAALENEGILVINMTFPDNPILLGQLPLAGAKRLAIRNDRVYVASTTNGLHIIDIANPSSLHEISHSTLPWPFQEFAKFYDLAIVDETVYLAAGESELIIYDIADEARPTLFEIAHIEGETISVVVNGKTIYVATRQGRLLMMERIDGRLVRRGIVDILGNCRDIKPLDGMLVLANGIKGLSITPEPSQLSVRLQGGTSRSRLPATAIIDIPPMDRPGVYNLALFEQGKLREFVGAVRVTEKQARQDRRQ